MADLKEHEIPSVPGKEENDYSFLSDTEDELTELDGNKYIP